MLINNIDYHRYKRTFTHEGLETVRQWLEVFGCCDELKTAIQNDIDSIRLARREAAKLNQMNNEERLRKLGRRKKDEVVEPPVMTVVIGMCPECGSVLHGEPVKKCETEKSGRVFYAQCSACTYYYEVFKNKRGKKHTMIEGGKKDG